MRKSSQGNTHSHHQVSMPLKPAHACVNIINITTKSKYWFLIFVVPFCAHKQTSHTLLILWCITFFHHHNLPVNSITINLQHSSLNPIYLSMLLFPLSNLLQFHLTCTDSLSLVLYSFIHLSFLFSTYMKSVATAVYIQQILKILLYIHIFNTIWDIHLWKD